MSSPEEQAAEDFAEDLAELLFETSQSGSNESDFHTDLRRIAREHGFWWQGPDVSVGIRDGMWP